MVRRSESKFLDKPSGRAEQYLTEYKTKNASGIRAVFRRLERLEAWKREMEGDTDFRYEVSTFGAEQLEEYMKYVTEEYDLYVKHPDFFAKFELYHSTMRPSSKNSSFICKLYMLYPQLFFLPTLRKAY